MENTTFNIGLFIFLTVFVIMANLPVDKSTYQLRISYSDCLHLGVTLDNKRDTEKRIKLCGETFSKSFEKVISKNLNK